MKRTYRKVLFRAIRGSLSRFLAIFFIVALGVGFLAGLLATTPDMRLSVDRYYDDTHMMDIRVLSTMGLTDPDVEAVRAAAGVGEVMPSRSADVLLVTPHDDTAVARIQSLPFAQGDDTPYLNRVILVDGRLPEKAGECVVEDEKLLGGTIGIGDTLALSAENKDLTDTLGVETITVVGVVKSAYYFSIERESSSVGKGTVDLFLYVRDDTFSLDVYTDLFVTVAGARALTAFSDAYDDAVQAVTDRLEDLSAAQIARRYDEVRGEAESALADATKEYEDQKREADGKLADAKKELDKGRQQITAAEKELAGYRRDLADGEKQLADGEKQLADGEAAYAAAKQQLADGRRQVEQGHKDLADGEQALNEQRAAFEKEIAAAQATLDDGQQQLDAGRLTLETVAKELAAAKDQIDQTKALIAQLTAAGQTAQAQALAQQLAPAEEAYRTNLAAYQEQADILDQKAQELEAGCTALQAQQTKGSAELAAGEQTLAASRDTLSATEKELTESEKKLAATRKTLDASAAALSDSRAQLADARQRIADGERSLSNAKTALADGEQTYEKSRQEADEKLADAERRLADARKEIDALAQPEWYVLDRHANVGYVSFEGNAEKVEAIAKVFPIFFFLVAALVALTTMTRMVEEERTQIGTMKALGYKKTAIAFKYILYAGVATVAGSIGGLLVGFQVFPTVIWGAYDIMYNLPPLITVFHVSIALIASLAAFLCTMLATCAACAETLAESPARLMQPRAPKPGKRVFLERVTFIWSHMRFTHKVTARNLIRYKKRFFMTVFGIAGCTALLLTGFGLRDSIGDIIGKQFGEILHYNMVIQMKSAKALDDPAVRQILDDTDTVSTYLLTHQENADVTAADGDSHSAYLYVPQQRERLTDFITLRERRGHREVPFDEGTVVVTEKLAETLGLHVGDTIRVKNADGRSAAVEIGGITENYVYGYVYMPPALYASAFGKEPEYLQVIGNAADIRAENRDALSEAMLKAEEVASVQFTTDLSSSFSDIIKNIDYIVVVLIVSAGLLAFVVLYNLTNINITEREKEIATIKVLGFYDREVSAYIYRETAILSLIGTACGLVLGIFLHAFVVKTAEVDIVMFGRSIKGMSYLLSALMTLFFSALVNLVMHRKLKRIDMVESMKAGE